MIIIQEIENKNMSVAENNEQEKRLHYSSPSSDNNVKFYLDVTRAYKDKDDRWLISGIASTTALDSHDTVMSDLCQQSFVEQVKARNEDPGDDPENEFTGYIKAEAQHLGSGASFFKIGYVIDSSLIDGKFSVVIELDRNNPLAEYYYKAMTIPDFMTKKVKTFGLSINGVGLDSYTKYDRNLKKMVTVFDRIALRRVGVVDKASNPECNNLKLVVREINSIPANKFSELKTELSLLLSSKKYSLENLTSQRLVPTNPKEITLKLLTTSLNFKYGVK